MINQDLIEALFLEAPFQEIIHCESTWKYFKHAPSYHMHIHPTHPRVLECQFMYGVTIERIQVSSSRPDKQPPGRSFFAFDLEWLLYLACLG